MKSVLSNVKVQFKSSTLTRVILVLAGAWAIAASAQWRVDLMPFSPVPITAQSLVVLLIGWYYRPAIAMLSVISYLAFGILGVPVFASKAAGMSWLMGTTGGYLFGFLLSALILSSIKQRWIKAFGSKSASVLGLLFIGKILILGPGVLWLAKFMGFNSALTAGLVPFLPGMIVKMLAALFVIKFLESTTDKINA